jgi:hypothetical protein
MAAMAQILFLVLLLLYAVVAAVGVLVTLPKLVPQVQLVALAVAAV